MKLRSLLRHATNCEDGCAPQNCNCVPKLFSQSLKGMVKLRAVRPFRRSLSCDSRKVSEKWKKLFYRTFLEPRGTLTWPLQFHVTFLLYLCGELRRKARTALGVVDSSGQRTKKQGDKLKKDAAILFKTRFYTKAHELFLFSQEIKAVF